MSHRDPYLRIDLRGDNIRRRLAEGVVGAVPSVGIDTQTPHATIHNATPPRPPVVEHDANTVAVVGDQGSSVTLHCLCDQNGRSINFAGRASHDQVVAASEALLQGHIGAVVDEATLDALCEAKIEAKTMVSREGSSLRTAHEINTIFVVDACHLLSESLPQLETPVGCEGEYEEMEQVATEFEHKLAEAGYLTLWHDGYTIYKGLTEEEVEYLTRESN